MPVSPAARVHQRHKAAPRAVSCAGVALGWMMTSQWMDMTNSLGEVSEGTARTRHGPKVSGLSPRVPSTRRSDGGSRGGGPVPADAPPVGHAGPERDHDHRPEGRHQEGGGMDLAIHRRPEGPGEQPAE